MANRDVPDKLGRTGAAKGGRTPGAKSAKSLRQRKLKSVLDYLDPIVAKAVNKASQILDADLSSTTVSATTQLQAAKLIIDKAIELNNDVYKKEPDQLEDPVDDEPKEVVQPHAVFSTKVIPIKGDE